MQNLIQKLGKKGLALLWLIVETALDAIWDALWAVVYNAIEHAEEKWQEGDYAQEKKDFVIEQALKFIEQHKKLGFLKKQAVKLFFNVAIDGIIKELNTELGKNWVEKAKEKEGMLDDFVPFVD